MLSIETKPNGSGNSWLELGKFKTDKFGGEVWKPNQNPRYPHQSKRLEVKRIWSGNRGGATEKIWWNIIVPDDYKLFIVKRWGDGTIKILFTPSVIENVA